MIKKINIQNMKSAKNIAMDCSGLNILIGTNLNKFIRKIFYFTRPAVCGTELWKCGGIKRTFPFYGNIGRKQMRLQ
ncbi:hypothetical protein D7Y06_03250 [Roseburia sp. 1XD42-69]|nr:hypothetical protein D7Y06_03250 [Roseburia sp. 1XD42-69]